MTGAVTSPPRGASFGGTLVAWLALATATPALATCPTIADLARGIVLQLDNGQVEVHKTVDRDMVQVDVRYNDGTEDGSVMRFAHGLYLHSMIPIEDGVLKVGQQEEVASSATLRSWAAPVPSATWQNARSDGGTARSGAMKTLRLGSCSYDAFSVTLTFADDPTYTEVYSYLPALGIGLLVESTLGQDREKYRYVSIATR